MGISFSERQTMPKGLELGSWTFVLANRVKVVLQIIINQKIISQKQAAATAYASHFGIHNSDQSCLKIGVTSQYVLLTVALIISKEVISVSILTDWCLKTLTFTILINYKLNITLMIFSSKIPFGVNVKFFADRSFSIFVRSVGLIVIYKKIESGNNSLF